MKQLQLEGNYTTRLSPRMIELFRLFSKSNLFELSFCLFHHIFVTNTCIQFVYRNGSLEEAMWIAEELSAAGNVDCISPPSIIINFQRFISYVLYPF